MSKLALIEAPSPNYSERPAGMPIDMLIMHYTGMPTGAMAIERLCDAETQVSAHYVVEEDGTIYRLVAEGNRAHHAGESFWGGQTELNDRSVGIEIVNPGLQFGYTEFPKEQMESVLALSLEILQRHPIPPERVLGHSDVAPLRRWYDPGEKFPWKWLAENGVGIWPELKQFQSGLTHLSLMGEAARLTAQAVSRAGEGVFNDSVNTPSPSFSKPAAKKNLPSPIRERDNNSMDALILLSRYGYQTGDSAVNCCSVAAFERHFRPSKITGVLDDECRAILDALCAQIGALDVA